MGIDGIEGASPIGQGASASVYRARQEAFNRTVAVKVFRTSGADGPAERQRFDDQCRVVSGLSRHPNIVAVYDWGTTSGGDPYVIMEYLSRGSLADRLGRDGALPAAEILDFGLKVAGALATAHGRGIVHGHLKAENILFSGTGEAQVADFVSPAVRTDAAGSAPSGTTHVAPEVFAGQPPDVRSDVYVLGSLLCAAFPDDTAFQEEDAGSFHPLLDRVFVQDPADLRPPGVPSALWEPIERALAPDRASRTPSAAAMVEDLQAAKQALEQSGSWPRRPSDLGLPLGGSGEAGASPRSVVAAALGSLRRSPAILAGLSAVAVIAVLAVIISWPGDDRTDLQAGPAAGRGDQAPEPPRSSIPTLPTTRPTIAPTTTSEVPSPTTTITVTQGTSPTTRPQPVVTSPPAVATTVPRNGGNPIVPTTEPPATESPGVATARVIGCDTFGQACDSTPIYASLPPPQTDPADVPTLTTVTRGTELEARCWARGARVYNYDPTFASGVGTEPYQSDIYYLVDVVAQSGWIADTFFVRSQGTKLGLPSC